MKLSEEQYEIIEAYLANELSAPDRASFEKDMQSDAELTEEVNRQRAIRLGLRAIGIERALERAKTQYQTQMQPAESASAQLTPTRSLLNWRYWAAAASVVAVLGVGYYAFQLSPGRQVDLAYAETMTPDQNGELLKEFPSGNLKPSVQKQLTDALRNYSEGNYADVITQLKTLPEDKKTVYYKNYILGLSYLANKQAAEAISLLSKAQASPSGKLRQKAEWFLALAYVKNGQKEKALPILKQISIDKAHPYYSLSQRVLKKIE